MTPTPAPATPAPTPAPAPLTPTAEKPTVTVPTTLKGFTVATFTASAQLAVKEAYAATFNVQVGSVQITDITAAARRRLAASDGVKFNVVVQAANPTLASDIEKKAAASDFSAQITTKVKQELSDNGVAVPAGFAATTEAPVLKTSAGGGSSSKVGLGVGLGLGLPALAALVYFGMKRKNTQAPATDNTKGFAVTQTADDVDAAATTSVEMKSKPSQKA